MPVSYKLTDRQRQIKERIDRGWDVRKIAADLGITRNAVYLHIQRFRRDGILPPDWTATGQPSRQVASAREEAMARTLHAVAETDDEEADAAGILALVQELRRTRDQLDEISRRLTAIVPR